jgi:hypothetical protein
LRTRPALDMSLREAPGTPESTRTATHDRSTLGSGALTRTLNLAEALSRLLLSPLTFVGMPPTLRFVTYPAPAAMGTRRDSAEDVS